MKPVFEKLIVWVLNSAPGGDRNASVSVAELITNRYKIIDIPGIETLPNANNELLLKQNEVLKFNELGFEIASKYMRLIKPVNYPDLVINTWKHKAPVAIGIKMFLALREKNCKVVNISLPHGSPEDFDLIALPDHYAVARRLKTANNVIMIRGTCHLVNSKRLNEAKNDFKHIFTSLPRPIFVVLLGGNSGDYIFTIAVAKNIGEQLNRLAIKMGASIVATNSHRTPSGAWKTFSQQITCRHYLFDANDTDNSRNPFFSILATANYIFCTGDSLSMTTEAAATGKPTFIIPPAGDTAVAKELRSFNRKMFELANVTSWKNISINRIPPPSSTISSIRKQLSNSEKVVTRIKSLYHT